MPDTVAVVWDGDEPPAGRSRRRWKGRALLAAVVVVVLVAVPVAIVSSRDSHKAVVIRVGKQSAEKTVLAALDAITNAGNYDMEYSVHTTPATKAARGISEDHCVTVTTDGHTIETCSSQGSSSSQSSFSSPSSGSSFVDINGKGTVSLDPYAQLAVSNVTGYGQITLRTDGNSVWEYGGADYGTTAQSGAAGGNSLSNFAGLVVSTIGVGPGALSLIGLANPAGYLQLEKEAVVNAAPAGTGSVDGTEVTYYSLTIDLTKIVDTPGLSAEQIRTITAALHMLASVDYRSTREKIGIDAAGFIREATVVSDFADGSAMTRVTKLSNFGCAGTVLMPGQTATATTAPAHCTAGETSTTAAPTSTEPTTTTTPATSTSATLTTVATPSTTTSSNTAASTTSTTSTSTTSGTTTVTSAGPT